MTTSSRINRTNSLICIATALLLFGNFSFAQDTINTTPEAFLLKELRGYSQIFFYSQGHENKAKSIATFMEDANAYFQKEIGFTPKTKLYILAPQHWKDFAAKPLKEVYGFPHNVDNSHLVIAAEDNDFWRSLLPPVDNLPSPVATALRKAYGTPDGSLSLRPFFDLLALHEMGHSYTAQAGLKMQRYWMGEFFVNLMLHTYVAEKHPELLPALEAFPNMVVGAGTGAYTYTSLKDFENLYPSLGMGPENYGWYQSKLHSAAKDSYNSGGKKVLKKLWNALKKHQETMTDEAFSSMLKTEVHPSVAKVYLTWNNTEY